MRKYPCTFRVSTIVALLASVCAFATAQQKHRVTPVGGWDGTQIGNDGTIVGTHWNKSYAWNSSFGFEVIPPLSRDPRHGNVAEGINNVGQVVGWDQSLQGQPRKAFLWSHGTGIRPVTDFGKDAHGNHISSEGNGGHDLSEVVGRYGHDDTWDSFYFRLGQGWTQLRRLDPAKPTQALFVNDAGQAVGYAGVTGGYYAHSVVWEPDGRLLDMGMMGAQTQTDPHGLNELGHVAGLTFGPQLDVGFLWTESGGYLPIYNPFTPRLYLNVFGLNDQDTLVGMMFDLDHQKKGFVWTALTGVVMLNDLLDPSVTGWDIACAYDVNDSGQIIGFGYHDGLYSSFVLDPVPEPPGWLAFAPLAVLVLRRRR